MRVAATPPERDDTKTVPPEREQDAAERGKRVPPDSIPDPMPGVDPQQSPGVDHPPAEWD